MWFWLRISKEVVIELLPGLLSHLKAQLGLEEQLPGWCLHMAVDRRPRVPETRDSPQGACVSSRGS